MLIFLRKRVENLVSTGNNSNWDKAQANGRYGEYADANEAGHGADPDADGVADGQKAKRHGADADDVEAEVRGAVLGAHVYKQARAGHAKGATIHSTSRVC